MIGKYHTSITSDALSSYFNSSELNLICKGNLDADEKKKNKYEVNAQHFNNDDLKECEKFLKEAEETTIEDFIAAAKSSNPDEEDENYIKAFYDLGRLVHCIQDFYSHTNWINQTGNETKVWNESSSDPNIDKPENLKTGIYSKFGQFLDKINIFSSNKLKKGKDYEEAYLKSDKNLSHYQLNKDKPGTIADKAFEAKEGVSGFDLACEDAEEHTIQEWQEINDALKEQLSDEEYEKLLYKLKDFNPSGKDYKEMLDECRTNFKEKMTD